MISFELCRRTGLQLYREPGGYYCKAEDVEKMLSEIVAGRVVSTDQKEVKSWTLRARSTRICTNFYNTEVSAEGPEIKGIFEVVSKSDFDAVVKERDNLIRTIALLREHKIQDQAEIAKLREALEDCVHTLENSKCDEPHWASISIKLGRKALSGETKE